ncbi:TlpA family protein disulfide reductase [Pedobacter sp. MW01-1-1]|uniref:TlpA family protein disulfide reductase n=1 Tax=Pedobacter sp. MW01-1-1 TaxID=3383027 RepID=UPI003FEEC23C
MKIIKWLFVATIIAVFYPKTYGQESTIQISGTLKGLGNKSVWVAFLDNSGISRSYKANAKDDQFSFAIPLQNNPCVARFNSYTDLQRESKANKVTSAPPKSPLTLLIYNKNIQIKGNSKEIEYAQVKGDEENTILNRYQQSVVEEDKLYNKKMDIFFNPAYESKQATLEGKRLKEEMLQSRKKVVEIQKEFIKANPEAFASLLLLAKMEHAYSSDNYIRAWNGLSDRYKSNPFATPIKSYVKKIEFTSAGTQAIDFQRFDTNGNSIHLSDFKGKMVLLDFWGSWCGPCRAGNPHLKKLHDKYKGKGFEIISISQERGNTLAESKKAWLKAISDDQMDWVNVLNQEDIERQDLVKAYGITAFPTKILLNTVGKIVHRVTSGLADDIDKELETFYGF